jgi:hypothetical protein
MRRQPALNLQMIQMQFDRRHAPGKIASYIIHANIEPDNPVSAALRFNHHE